MPNSDDGTPKKLSENLFPVVGVGASAGGLEAFKQLLRAIPDDSGLAYILVQHLDPFHESILAEILQKVTRIPVSEITDNVKVMPDHIYIIPSNKMLVATDGILKLDQRPPKPHKNMPIDVFFSSLAEIHQKHAIGVVLSGTGTDGTLGLKAIKDHGGLTFAQELESAAYDGMPSSAISSNSVDFILTPDKMYIRKYWENMKRPRISVSKVVREIELSDFDSVHKTEIIKKIKDIGVDEGDTKIKLAKIIRKIINAVSRKVTISEDSIKNMLVVKFNRPV